MQQSPTTSKLGFIEYEVIPAFEECPSCGCFAVLTATGVCHTCSQNGMYCDAYGHVRSTSDDLC